MNIDTESDFSSSPGTRPERPTPQQPRRSRRKSLLVATLAGLPIVFGGGTWLWAQSRPFQGGPTPAFGSLVATPPNFVFNTPTTVTFTIQIDTPTLNPTTVELQRVDAAGNLLARVDRMYDNGQNGDSQSDDKTFTARLTLNEAFVGRIYFRVGAAFRGNRQNAWSPPARVDVDPFPLPPDPGQAGAQTLEGIDSDGDGVRDDVQRYIAYTYQNSARSRSALGQAAVALHAMVVSADNSSAARTASTQEVDALQCLTALYGAKEANRMIGLLDSRFLNTDQRIRAYYRAGAYPAPVDVIGELSSPLPNARDFCAVDPETLPN